MRCQNLLQIFCDVGIAEDCEGELKNKGAILISPPDNENKYRKYHICINCYNKLMETIILMG